MPTASFLDGQIQLFLGDAREIVPALNRKFRVACYDAPYLLTSGGSARSSAKHKVMSGGWMAGYDNSGMLMETDITWKEIMQLAASCLEPDADVYAFTNDKNQYEAQREAFAAGLKFHNLLVWDKKTATANGWYMKNCEFVLYFYRGRARRIANCGDKQLVTYPHRDETNHPTEKPVPLVESYIRNSALPGESVIDMFMGSGTTALACLRTGNPFVGVEIDPAHFETATRRVERALSEHQIDLSGFRRGNRRSTFQQCDLEDFVGTKGVQAC
ncbi:DNA-methyltransferase [Roseibium sediminicola]|uniref:Methyltransferase n=1 Tax=Roseibium sediminicola TaxID=2933272 RepID=A0ABT0GRY0_9HYPH|nr:site-specific DNA-methyltransferase [Roseibium sp. CAU 1639]MCK7611985.1 site-specific DNA-methyltransferase [Roseibium sp. CAU 1639]